MLQKEYLKLKDSPNTKTMRTDLRNAVKASEKNALEMLVELYDWLDRLEPLPTVEMFSLHEDTPDADAGMGDTLASSDQAMTVSFTLFALSAWTP